MAERSFLNDILRRVAFSPRSESRKGQSLAAMCRALMTERSEASGLVLAREILDRYEAADSEDRRAFFAALAADFGSDDDALAAAVKAWSPGNHDAARALHFAAEPRSQELIRVLNRVPGATARLVRMRADLLAELPRAPELAGLDSDFRHLFVSWFNRGFLELRRIGWATPANVLEKIIAYEAVHEITGWDDLRQRVAEPDRRLFGFFHPAMPDEPLIFVEVALMDHIPGAITEIIAPKHDTLDPAAAKVAVFYSISNCQKGLRGISFGNFLIKQVVAELTQELPQLTTFVTLSPVPGLRRHVEERAETAPADTPDSETVRRLAARYLAEAKRANGKALDPVAHFHLSNGAELHAIHAGADPSESGQRNSWGVMVNYLYDSERSETNQQGYAETGEIALSPKLRPLLRK